MVRKLAALILLSTTWIVGCSDDTSSIELEEKGQFDNLGNAESPNSSDQDEGTPSPYEDAEKIDILYVADNTGSMCQEQAELRDRFRDFVLPLVEAGIDFQIGITTTQMVDDYPPEPVAQPGELQSTPQPIPGFDPTCINTVGPDGAIIEDDFKPVREVLQLAAECAGVDPTEVDLTDEEISCYFRGGGGEACVGLCENCRPADLFEELEFPEFPKVLKAEDYRGDDGALDLEQLNKDFRCMALVGTRGYGIEKGLEAAALAVSPEKTGYAVGLSSADENAPNHGLIRQDSRFALVFLTDENDCSHDGSLAEDTSCGGDVCEFALTLDPSESPLVPVTRLKENLLRNLSDTKGRIVDEDEITVISFHGTPVARELPGGTTYGNLSEYCSSPDFQAPEFACVSFLGRIQNGSRYSDFAELFTHAYPPPQNGEVPGAMCDRNFGAIFDESYRALLR